jgi:hypothetical protein
MGVLARRTRFDSTAPLLITATYMYDSKPQTESTFFHETCYHHHHHHHQVDEEGDEEEDEEEEHGIHGCDHIRELYVEGEELDHALGSPWHEHRVLFNQKVDVGRVALFAAGVIHRGPAVHQNGLRCVLFQPCVAWNNHIPTRRLRTSSISIQHSS